jgi:hypothetical protein
MTTPDAPFTVLEVACPLPRTWPTRWEATLGRDGTPELLVVASGATHVPPIRVLAPGTDVAILTALDAQAAGWAAEHAAGAADSTAAHVAHLVSEYVATWGRR